VERFVNNLQGLGTFATKQCIRISEARDLLTSVYEWLTEGFATKDLKEARTLLGELN